MYNSSILKQNNGSNMSIDFKKLKINIHNAAHYNSDQARSHVIASAQSLSVPQQDAVLKILNAPAHTHQDKIDNEHHLIAMFPDLAQRAHSIKATKAVLTNKNLQDSIFTYVGPDSYKDIHDPTLPGLPGLPPSWRESARERVCQYARERTRLSEEDLSYLDIHVRLDLGASLRMMTHVSTLDLSRMQGHIPSRLLMLENFLPLQTITCLNLSYNKNLLGSLIAKLLGQCTELRHLDLQGSSNLNDQTLLSSCDLHHLTHLDLRGIALQDTALFQHLIDRKAPLRYLAFDMTDSTPDPTKTIFPALLGHCRPSLESLSLSYGLNSSPLQQSPQEEVLLGFLANSACLHTLHLSNPCLSVARLFRIAKAQDISVSFERVASIQTWEELHESIAFKPQSAFGKLYHAALSQADHLLPDLFSQLSPKDQQLVLNGARSDHLDRLEQAGRISHEDRLRRLSLPWTTHDLFASDMRLADSIRASIQDKYNDVLFHHIDHPDAPRPTGFFDKLHFFVWELAGRPTTADPNWGGSNAMNNLCRLADAFELADKNPQ
jgi:hypothetical protein